MNAGDLIVGALSLLIAGLAYALGFVVGRQRPKPGIDGEAFDRNMRHWLGG